LPAAGGIRKTRVIVKQDRPTLAILGGTGALGCSLATRWAAAGYPVVLGSRSRDKAETAARGIQAANGARRCAAMRMRAPRARAISS